MEELETFKSKILKLYEMDFTEEEISKIFDIPIETIEKIIDEHRRQMTIRYLDKFYAEEGNSREDRFKSDLEDMKRIGYEEGRIDGINTTALAMLENNFSIEDIAKVTKMSVNKIKTLMG